MSGLIQARALRQAADLDRADRLSAVGAFLEAWRAEIREHFDDEERLLLPLVRSRVLRDRLLDEHAFLRRLAAQGEQDRAAAAADADLVRRIGDRLHDHIRWEERELFEAVQRDHPEALAALVPEAAFIEERRAGSRPRRGPTSQTEGGRDE
jgi:hemerythrin-like domain-containing protein